MPTLNLVQYTLKLGHYTSVMKLTDNQNHKDTINEGIHAGHTTWSESMHL